MGKICQYNDFTEFINQKGANCVWHFWVYKRNIPAHDATKNIPPAKQFEDEDGYYGVIKDVVTLGDDYLIGFQYVFESEYFELYDYRPILYFKLSEIRLACDGSIAQR